LGFRSWLIEGLGFARADADQNIGPQRDELGGQAREASKVTVYRTYLELAGFRPRASPMHSKPVSEDLATADRLAITSIPIRAMAWAASLLWRAKTHLRRHQPE
jgi:hypothetical protein